MPRKIIPSLRIENQPVGIAGKITYSVKVKLTTKIKSLISLILVNLKPILGIESVHAINTGMTSNSKSIDNGEIYKTMLNFHITSYSRYPNQKLLSECFTSLKEYVNALEQKGATIIFYEMPVNEKLCNLPREKTIRETFIKYFPPGNYHYIPIPDCSEYKTMDGEHLTSEESIKYTDYFKVKSARCLIKNPSSQNHVYN